MVVVIVLYSLNWEFKTHLEINFIADKEKYGIKHGKLVEFYIKKHDTLDTILFYLISKSTVIFHLNDKMEQIIHP